MAQLSRMAELGMVGRRLSSFGINASRRVPESRRCYSLLQRPVMRQSFPRRRPLSPLSLSVHIARRQASTEPLPKPRRRFPVLRWIWRLTWMSALGGLAFVGYQVYTLRYPIDQFEPDPSKKTLVILGTGWGAVSLLKKLDTELYNVIVVSPRNYFLFTPLLPSCTTGTVEHRSIMEPVRNILRHKRTRAKYYEAEATKVDYERRVVKIVDESEVKGDVMSTEVPFDLLVVSVGAENATFGIPGVREHSCFLKEVGDAQAIRKRIMDCVETATFKDQTPEEIERLLHMVVVGGGPTGVEFAAELRDFFDQDLKKWIPEIADKFRVTLVEALPTVLPSFSKQLIDYTEKTFNDEHITLRTKTMVKKVTDKTIEAEVTNPDGSKAMEILPYGLLVWATGNAVRPVVKDLMAQIPAQKNARRGLEVNEYLVVKGTENVWAVGDCAIAGYAPTAQAAAQEGNYLARLLNAMGNAEDVRHEMQRLNEVKSQSVTTESERSNIEANIEGLDKQLRRIKQVGPFKYTHQGSLAYIGSDKAVADVQWFNGNFASGGGLTMLFWRSAYLSMCFSARNRILVLLDWVKAEMFGRDVSRE
ncbi:MAG: External alternative NADH-ubiquinone oxidoreductase mitochondrial [Watsoniomyces obsoletus]|nr:MAG: External alternative NADH-ubiquinone oxidoreductase mitochondrial [Watsoniomyces obsoletus]